MNLLCTGACGFIGSHFVRHVITKPEIDLIVSLDCLTYAGSTENLGDALDHPKHNLRTTNIRDKGAVAGVIKKYRITHIMHLAAETHVDRSIFAPSTFCRTNVDGTMNLLDAAVERHVDRFVHVSTDEVYGPVPDGFSDELAPLQPSSPYAATKAASDMLVMSYARTYGVPAIITRSSNNYGLRQFPEKFIPVVVKSIKAGKPVPVYGDGLYYRDWLHVSDHVEALWQVLIHGKVGQVYNISAMDTKSNLDIVQMILGITGRGSIEHVADRPGHDRRYAPDSTKIRKQLGWSPQVPLDYGLTKTVLWYLSL